MEHFFSWHIQNISLTICFALRWSIVLLFINNKEFRKILFFSAKMWTVLANGIVKLFFLVITNVKCVIWVWKLLSCFLHLHSQRKIDFLLCLCKKMHFGPCQKVMQRKINDIASLYWDQIYNINDPFFNWKWPKILLYNKYFLKKTFVFNGCARISHHPFRMEMNMYPCSYVYIYFYIGRVNKTFFS